MIGNDELTALVRLEDFIASAKKGVKISATVDLQKQYVSQKIHPENSEELKSEMNMYLLLGNFTFKIGGEQRIISKVYMFSSAEESASDTRINTNIANARLRDDYKRLAAANISVEEKLF
ncbi:MAG TPA: hypothetical protein VJW95_05215 [Dissulfurispiraceae bacterium]|nr:hypothetical protein [Dissulfurispiraceae bacterium]